MNGWSSVLRQTTVLCLLLAVGLALVLFSVKHQVQSLEGELSELNAQIVADRETIRVLQAEFSSSIDPEHLRRLSSRYLADLKPVEPEQLGSFAIFREAPDGAGDPTHGARPGLGLGLKPAHAQGTNR